MDAAGRDADFGAEAELAAIGKLSGSIVQHDGTIDTGQEFFRDAGIFSHDGIGMAG